LHSWRHQRSGATSRRHGPSAIGGNSPSSSSSSNPLVVISGPLPEEEPADKAAPSTEEAKLKTVIDEQIRPGLARKNPPKKNHPKKTKKTNYKTHKKCIFFGFFWGFWFFFNFSFFMKIIQTFLFVTDFL
jgi:hypothetical protein